MIVEALCPDCGYSEIICELEIISIDVLNKIEKRVCPNCNKKIPTIYRSGKKNV